MSNLSGSDARTIKMARRAIDMIMHGAIRQIETQFGPHDEQDRAIATDALILHCREELDEWSTRHERGDIEAELTTEQTTL